jgi:type II secretory pathway pseudopilin PulG
MREFSIFNPDFIVINFSAKGGSASGGQFSIPIQSGSIHSGFTLIELIVAFALSISIAMAGLVSYTKFNQTQKFKNTVLDVRSELQKAKSRAQSQVKPSTLAACQTAALTGYAVRFCTFPNSQCAASGRYELHIVCGGTSTLIEAKQLPAGITFQVGTNGIFLFNVLNGAVQSGSVSINGYGQSKTIQVSGTGTISVL